MRCEKETDNNNQGYNSRQDRFGLVKFCQEDGSKELFGAHTDKRLVSLGGKLNFVSIATIVCKSDSYWLYFLFGNPLEFIELLKILQNFSELRNIRVYSHLDWRCLENITYRETQSDRGQ